MPGSLPEARGRSRALRLLARALLAAAAVWLGVNTYRLLADRQASKPDPGARAVRESEKWTSNAWERWAAPRYGIALQRPGFLPPDEPFEEFTERQLGDLKAAPVVAFRGDHPIVIYRYRAPGPQSWEAWRRRLRADPQFRLEFGGHLLEQRPTVVSSRPALEILAEGATAGRLWRYVSLFLARGEFGFRVTAGAPQRDWPALEAPFRRLLSSVRLAEPR